LIVSTQGFRHANLSNNQSTLTPLKTLDRPQDTSPKPPARLILTTPEHLIAFGFGAGLAPKAPGTFGTIVAVPVWLALCWLDPLAYVIVVAVLFAFGVWLCGRSARLLGLHDTPGIVFDEIVGFLVTAAPLIPAVHQGNPWLWLLVAFGLFRFFDIAKPWPIRHLDEAVPGGFGIMLDDLVAGLYGAALLGLLTQLL
jgi:phosphatidylglycerophosphatase A